MSFTENQEKAIKSNNKKILVSAGAGSGKTLVLSSRVVRLVEEGNSLDNIVVLTFTKAAAAEMKQRIKKLLQEGNSEIAKQNVENVESAPITTLHGFASRVLKQYFYEIGIDPAFGILEETESNALKIEALESVLQKEACQRRNEFFDLVDVLFQNRTIENIKNIIFEIHGFLCSLPSPEEYVLAAKNLYENSENSKKLLRFLIDEVSERASYFLKKLYILMDDCKQDGLKKLVDVLAELELNLLRVKPTNSIEQMQKAAEEFSAPSKIMRGENAEKAENVAAFKTQVKKFFDSIGELFCIENKEQNSAENQLAATKRIEELFGIYEKFVNEYNARKEELGVLDFADLERNFFNLLKTKSGKEIKNSIKYLFVDEYQDTNNLQQAIYEMLDCENYFFVGDVKQSIYGFRLAEPKIFLQTRTLFRKTGGEVINLNENFRSHQELIDFTNKLFSKVMTLNVGGEDYLTEGNMKKGGDSFCAIGEGNGIFQRYSPANYPRVKIVSIKKAKTIQNVSENLPVYSVLEHQNSQNEKISSAVAEGKALAKVLKDLSEARIYDAKLGQERNVESSDIAVLTASRGEYLSSLLKSAQDEGYSFSPDITNNILEDADINELICLLKLVSNPLQDVPLFIVLSGYWGNMSANDLAEIKLASPSCEHFYEAVENFENAQNGTKEHKKILSKLKKVYKFIDELRFKFQSKNVNEVIDEIVYGGDFGVKILKKPNGEQKMLLLDSLKEQLIKSKSNTSLDSFLWTCENVGFFASGAGAPTKGGVVYDENGNPIRSFQNITVTTIHKSKGLEYPIVILVGAGRQFNRDSLTKDVLLSRNFGVGISGFDTMQRLKGNNIIKNAIRLDLQKQELEEDIRLLYVAVTRAINNLIVIGIGDPTEPETIDKNILSSANFFDLFSKIFAEKFPPLYISVAKESYEMLSTQTNTQNARFVGFPTNNELIDEFVNAFEHKYESAAATTISKKYSVSELSEKEKIIDAMAVSSDSTSDIGNAYHHFMQYVDFKTKTQEQLEEQKVKMLKSGYVSAEELSLLDDEKLLKCLNSPMFTILANGKRKVMREQQFLMRASAKDLKLDENCEDFVLVQGVFDLVVFDGERVIVLDYKTGGARSDEELIKKHSKQMQLYKMAAEKAFLKPVHTAIYSFKMDKLVRVD